MPILNFDRNFRFGSPPFFLPYHGALVSPPGHSLIRLKARDGGRGARGLSSSGQRGLIRMFAQATGDEMVSPDFLEDILSN